MKVASLLVFVVSYDGSIYDVLTIRSPHPSLTKAAERVVSQMPKWRPAKLNGKLFPSRLVMPIMFKLMPSEDNYLLNEVKDETK